MANLTISFKPAFVRQLNKLELAMQDEAIARFAMLKNTQNHDQLAVHKLHGPLRGRYAFSVNFKYRIVFQYLSKIEVVLLAIGDHEIYR